MWNKLLLLLALVATAAIGFGIAYVVGTGTMR